ncbi:hypothetical protein [Photorhabdus africana]|uniref:hypothetical protein n=1 Tax=Photorhabdus africana TaxID=3097554 RepID=UPI002B404B4C|nr:hypothetical protein [Photorhabdus sp. CRI-LC]
MQIVADLEQRSGQIGFPCVRGAGRGSPPLWRVPNHTLQARRRHHAAPMRIWDDPTTRRRRQRAQQGYS